MTQRDRPARRGKHQDSGPGWKRYRLGLAIGLMGVLSSTCAIDDRPVSVGGDATPPVIGSLMPQLRVVPDSLNLGPVVVGSPARARLQLTNAGNERLAPPAVALASDSDLAFSLLHNRCEEALAPGASCELRLQLLADRAGPFDGKLVIEAAGAAFEVPLAGIGNAPGALVLAPATGSSDNFGDVRLGESAPAVFNLTNTGANESGPLAIHLYNEDVTLVTGDSGSCVSGVTSLGAGETCDVHLAFSPTRRGAADALLVVTSDVAGSVGLQLSGRGRVAGSLAVSHGNLDFDGVVLGDAGQRALRVTNDGDEPLVLAGITLEGAQADEFSIQSSDCTDGRALPAGAGCAVIAEFRPTTSGEDKAAVVTVAMAGGSPRTVQLLGAGLDPGSLVLTPVAGASPDFGDVMLGEERSQVFQVASSSAQTSGPLALSVSGDFVLEEPVTGDCENGLTSLESGGSCTLRVKLTPDRRAAQYGSISIRSPLAKNASLGLSGRGLAPARLALAQDELNFGRVLSGGTYRAALTLQNRGDQLLPAPGATLLDPLGASGFSVESGCIGPLGFDATCTVNVRFEPMQPGFPSAVLRLESVPGGRASALVFGEVSVRGTLVVAAALGGSPDFGDVAIGAAETRDFTLSNSGDAASGRLSITATSPLFSIEPGDCNSGGTAGLAPGASCTFGVTFTPLSADAVSATLSIQSPAAGGAALSLTGQGRSPANLAAPGNQDFGTANIGQTAITEQRNDFAWTVTNAGDLASGLLQVTNSNPADFTVAADGCNGQSLAGHASCEVSIRFRPPAVGAKSGDLTVLDTASNQAVTLKMTGTGVQIARPGESCVTATCATGVCTGGVCCDRACVGGCQVCSPQGVCIDQDDREECGDGSGVCFGVDRCLLPEGQACSGDNQCGSGNCERRLGSASVTDQVCCVEDCGTGGDHCSPDGLGCQAPTLGAGAACGAPGQLPCGAGLVCKACLDGSRQCTPPNVCCGGCSGSRVCTNGTCACPAGTIDCGGGLCAQDRANACCPDSPECSDAQPFCDRADNLCKECVNSAQCGTNAVCTNGSCACAANTRSCPDGRCIGATQCCDACSGPCQTCNGTTGNCGTIAAGQPGRCPAGQVCGANGQCGFTNVGLGQACNVQANNCSVGTCSPQGVCACSGATPNACGGNRCVNFLTDGANCGGCGISCGTLGCNGQGQCNCPVGQTFVPGQGCRLNDGQACTPGSGVACRNGCNSWRSDCDGDDYPRRNSIVVNRCGPTPPTGVPAGCSGAPAKYVTETRQDCCDSSVDAFPGQQRRFASTLPASCINDSTPSYDWNCSGTNDGAPVRDCTLRSRANCAIGNGTDPSVPGSIVVHPHPANPSNAVDGAILCGQSVSPGTCAFFEDAASSPFGIAGCSPATAGFSQLPCN